jgi:hypothetical protein
MVFHITAVMWRSLKLAVVIMHSHQRFAVWATSVQHKWVVGQLVGSDHRDCRQVVVITLKA